MLVTDKKAMMELERAGDLDQNIVESLGDTVSNICITDGAINDMLIHFGNCFSGFLGIIEGKSKWVIILILTERAVRKAMESNKFQF